MTTTTTTKFMPATEPIGIAANARRVLEARYLRRDEHGQISETAQQLFARVARTVAAAESQFGGPAEARKWEGRFFQLMSSLDFLPNSPTLMNAGAPGAGQLSACFVLPVHDSMQSIFDALKLMALIQRSGGGTGFSFSRLRPRGARVASTGGEASGPVSFMRIFDCATEHIKLGGKRRGANMGVLRVDHPDILEFITAKEPDPAAAAAAALRNFNLSVGVTDAFMQAVAAGKDYPLIEPQTGRERCSLSARHVFDTIVSAAHRSGDPGLVFLDAINRANPTPQLGAIEATNPCGEVPLLGYECCNLGSINLARMLRYVEDEVSIDWNRLAETVRVAVRFLDDVIDVNAYPATPIERMARGNRKIGLGVMGFADALIRLGIPYDSSAAVEVALRIMRAVERAAQAESLELAQARGAFPFWDRSTYRARGIKIRNATLTAIAPTGTISIIANTSPSIEPLFALAYRRTNVLDGQTLLELTPLLQQFCRRREIDARTLLPALREHGTLPAGPSPPGLPELPEQMRNLFQTALQIPPRQHLRIQAAFQRYTDNSVSKTVNLPEEATVEDVARIYRSAWKIGLKGVTIYRCGSRSDQVLQAGSGEEPFTLDHGARCDPTECRL